MNTDTQLKQALAKMLPDVIADYYPCDDRTIKQVIEAGEMELRWLNNYMRVLDTELLHLCWLVEEGLNDVYSRRYVMNLHELTKAYHSFGRPENYWIVSHATWQQRVTALAKARGIEV